MTLEMSVWPTESIKEVIRQKVTVKRLSMQDFQKRDAHYMQRRRVRPLLICQSFQKQCVLNRGLPLFIFNYVYCFYYREGVCTLSENVTSNNTKRIQKEYKKRMLGQVDARSSILLSLIFILTSPFFLLFAAIKVFFAGAVNVFSAIGMLLSCAYCRRFS